MHTHSLAAYVQCIERDDWAGVGDLMLASATKLAAIGADVLISPDNTIHQAYDYAAGRAPLRWLHIADGVAAQASERGFRRIGILGTRWLTCSDVYPHKFQARGIDFLRPEDAEREEIHRIIMAELVNGELRPESEAYLCSVINRMRDAGCDAVVLGCTELPLIVSDANSALPILDSTRLLARAAVRHVLAGDSAATASPHVTF